MSLNLATGGHKVKNKIDAHLGERMAQARKQAGLSYQAVAEHLEMPVSAYLAIEQGERRVNALLLARISRLFGLPIGWFYQGLPGQDSFARPIKGSSV